jgi:oligopeptide transport system permease protein
MIDPRSPLQKLRRNPVVIASVIVLFLVALSAVIGPSLMPQGSGDVTSASFLSPCKEHWLGTDLNGRDLLFRIFIGAQISLLVGIAGALVSFSVGILYGMISGYTGGKTDEVMMRIVDVLYAIPRLIFLLVLISAIDPLLRTWMEQHGFASQIGYSKIFILIFSIGLTEWLPMARIIRGQVLSLKTQPFVIASKCVGQSNIGILFRHLLPNLIGVAIVYLTLTVPAIILDESFLSFLGVGVQSPLASWGLLLSDAAQVINPIRGYWWLLIFPAIAMSITLLALNFLGDGLRDAFDPRQRPQRPVARLKARGSRLN